MIIDVLTCWPGSAAKWHSASASPSLCAGSCFRFTLVFLLLVVFVQLVIRCLWYCCFVIRSWTPNCFITWLWSFTVSWFQLWLETSSRWKALVNPRYDLEWVLHKKHSWRPLASCSLGVAADQHIKKRVVLICFIVFPSFWQTYHYSKLSAQSKALENESFSLSWGANEAGRSKYVQESRITNQWVKQTSGTFSEHLEKVNRTAVKLSSPAIDPKIMYPDFLTSLDCSDLDPLL